MPAYVPALLGTHCTYPQSDGQTEFPWVVTRKTINVLDCDPSNVFLERYPLMAKTLIKTTVATLDPQKLPILSTYNLFCRNVAVSIGKMQLSAIYVLTHDAAVCGRGTFTCVGC